LALSVWAALPVHAGNCPPVEALRAGHMGEFQFVLERDRSNTADVTEWTSAELRQDSAATFLLRMRCGYATQAGGTVSIEWLAGGFIQDRIAPREEWILTDDKNGNETLVCTRGLLQCHWF